MHLYILSRSAQLYSTDSLLKAARRAGHHAQVVDHTRCNLFLDQSPTIYYEAEKLRLPDAILPRIGASVTEIGVRVIQQFEAARVFSAVRSDALGQARDKLRSLQILSRAGVPVPRSFFLHELHHLDYAIDRLGGAPVIVKLLESTHGTGVILAESKTTAASVTEAFVRNRQPVLLQEYIRESRGADVRAFVVGGNVVAAMLRQAAAGEFRSNLHRGATGTVAQLSTMEEQIAIRAAKVLRLGIAGVDLLRSDRGPLVIEVNASPGLEGIETYTGVDVAGHVMHYVEARFKQHRTQLFNNQ